MSVPFQFKRLALSDLPQVMAIEREVFRSPWSASVMRDSLLAAHTQTWGMVAEESAELIGFAILSVVLDEVELLTMSVAGKFHRQGYGDQLMAFLLTTAKNAGAETLYLEVNVHNSPAIEFYRKHAFVQTGLRKAYYTVPGSTEKDDALLMARKLDDGCHPAA